MAIIKLLSTKLLLVKMKLRTWYVGIMLRMKIENRSAEKGDHRVVGSKADVLAFYTLVMWMHS